MIKNMSVEYRQKIFPITTQKYLYRTPMEESIQDLTTQIIQHRKGITTTNVENTMGSLKSTLGGQTSETTFFINCYYLQIPQSLTTC